MKQSQDRDFTLIAPTCPQEGPFFLFPSAAVLKRRRGTPKETARAPPPWSRPHRRPAAEGPGGPSGIGLTSSAQPLRPAFPRRLRRRSPFRLQRTQPRPFPQPCIRRLRLRRPRPCIRIRPSRIRTCLLHRCRLRRRSSIPRRAGRRQRRSWAAGRSCGPRSSGRGADGERARPRACGRTRGRGRRGRTERPFRRRRHRLRPRSQEQHGPSWDRRRSADPS